MGYYGDEPPRHGHRNPSELAEDEMLSAFHGKFCGMPATIEEMGPSEEMGSGEHACSTRVELSRGLTRIHSLRCRQVTTTEPQHDETLV
jgi:hypothetical protein